MSEASDSSGAIKASLALLAATVVALVIANSGLASVYKTVLALPIGGDIGPFDLSNSLKDWIKNALMAVFFVFVGLEIKEEFREGTLSDRAGAILPFAAAVGGMAVPALVYVALTNSTPGLSQGWAIPSATDIAFAIGIVGFLGKRISTPLRAFLLAVAVIDDLAAILVIAVFYSGALQGWGLAGMAVSILALAALNYRNVPKLWPYMAAGAVLWLFTLQSGINATLAGVITALFIPLRAGGRELLHQLVELLRNPVNFFIMPVFAFANAGVPLFGLGLADLMQPLTLGIALGLIIGKPVGITLFAWLATAGGFARLPHGVSWPQIMGIACLAGIGFTMSLFIGGLAFTDEGQLNQVRLGVLGGSLVSTILGVGLLLSVSSRHRPVSASARA
ncbi:MAG: Na+/H+ antiporter NhaA [Pseudomonadota bacterium]